jgi:predicted lipid-binding transport protein (Tim44 family)
MKRSLVLSTLGIVVLSGFLVTADAWARAGGGGSGGSRGSRSYSAPARPSPSPVTPSRPEAPTGFQQPQRSGWGSGLLGGLAGFALGGLIGSMLFGGLGHGFGFGLMDLLLLAGLALFAFSWLRRRQQATANATGHGAVLRSEGLASRDYAPAGDQSSARLGSGGTATAQDWRRSPSATAELTAAPGDLERGLGHIRQMDSTFDAARMAEVASDTFFKVQGAWTGRDMSPVRDLLTPEMYGSLQEQCERLRAGGRTNRLENIAVRSAQVTEAWQENGQDFVTVYFLASVLDYTTDDTGRVLEGSRTEPVKFEEFWTFTRPVGPQPWRLGAIQQAA